MPWKEKVTLLLQGVPAKLLSFCVGSPCRKKSALKLHRKAPDLTSSHKHTKKENKKKKMSKPMPPIWWYKSLQKLILDKKKIFKIKKCFCKLFFSSSPFLQSTDTMKKKENYYQQRLKKTEKTNKLERILKFMFKKWKQKKIVVLEVGRRRKKW